MSRYVRFAARHPYLLAALVVVLFLPWAWMSFLIPRWALAICIGLAPLAAMMALALVMKDMSADDEAMPVGDEPFLKWRKRTRLFQQVVVGLDTMLERWDAAAQLNRKKLQAMTESVEEVIRLTENAVTEISKSFRVVVAKANEQTEAAMSLLKGGSDEQRGGILSLPDFIKAYESQLENVTSHMTSFSQAADEMASHQKRVSEHAQVMEVTIDGLRNMASQISRIALDGSVAMTSQTLNPRDFVDMTDRIRAISAEAHELTRKTRQGLDAIGDEVRQGNKRTTQVAEAARRAVDLARVEIATLNSATIEQTRQIEGTLKRINDLSMEIQHDINQIIVAMQFQDITRQKLEREHKPTLGATADSLSLLSHETQALLQRDLYRAVKAYAHSAFKPKAGAAEDAEQAERAARALEDTQDRAGDEPQPAPAVGGDKKVEIF